MAHTGKRRGAYIVLMAKPDGKIPLGKPRHIWEVNIKINPTETGWGGSMDRIDLAQDRDK
jgi:hypothetical protein